MLQHQNRSTESLQYFHPQQNKTWGTVAQIAVSVGGSLLSSKSKSKAAKEQIPEVDIEALNALVNQQAESNARKSLALENSLTPENQALRRGSISNLLAQVNRGSPEQDEALQSVLAQLRQITPAFEQSLRSPLQEAAVARAGEDLALGGNLPLDVRNAVTRRALSTAGRVGGGRIDQGRVLAPRDLGLTSLDLRNQRLATAGQLGQADVANRASRAALPISLRSQLAGQASGLSANRLGQILSLANFGGSLEPPVTGLSPSDVADITTGNQANRYQSRLNNIALKNSANQDLLQGAGSIFGAFFNGG